MTKTKTPATAAAAARTLPLLTSPRRRAKSCSATWRIASRQGAEAGSTPTELRDQKLSSTQRNSGLQPNQPSARSPANSTTDHTPMTSEAILLVTVLSHKETRNRPSPIRRPGRMSSTTQATTSLAKLISTNMLPARERRERRWGLHASSSISPNRGSMTELRSALARLASVLDGMGGMLYEARIDHSTSIQDNLPPTIRYHLEHLYLFARK